MFLDVSFKSNVEIPTLNTDVSTVKQYSTQYALNLLNQKNRPRVTRLRTRNQIGNSNLVGLTTRMQNDVVYLNCISRIILKDF